MNPKALFELSELKSLFLSIGKVASELFPAKSGTFGDGQILTLVSFFLSYIMRLLKLL